MYCYILKAIFSFIMTMARDMLNCWYLKEELCVLYRDKIMTESKREHFRVPKFRSSHIKMRVKGGQTT